MIQWLWDYSLYMLMGFLIWEMKVLGNPKIVLIIQLVRMDIGLFKAKIFVKKRGMSGQ